MDVLKGLGDQFNDNPSESGVLIARCNVAKTAVPVALQHIPTIQLYPVGRKSKPLEYFGRKGEMERYVNFMQEEVGNIKSVSRRNSERSQESEKEFFGETASNMV